MSHFKLLQTVDTSPFIEEIHKAVAEGSIPADFGPLNTLHDLVQHFGAGYTAPHKESSWQLLVRPYPLLNPELHQATMKNSQLLYRTELYAHFPRTIAFLRTVARKQNATLERVIFARLLPGGEVLPHRDGGQYFTYRDRYHVVLESPDGSEFTVGGEKQIFREGEIWWFANKERHSVKNLSNAPRLHIIFDLLPKSIFTWRAKAFYTFWRMFFQAYIDQRGVEGLTTLVTGNAFLRSVLCSGPKEGFLRTV